MFLRRVEVRKVKGKGKGVFLCEDVPADAILWSLKHGGAGDEVTLDYTKACAACANGLDFDVKD